jgi:hypothetical protein
MSLLFHNLFCLAMFAVAIVRLILVNFLQIFSIHGYVCVSLLTITVLFRVILRL